MTDELLQVSLHVTLTRVKQSREEKRKEFDFIGFREGGSVLWIDT